jgi:hypothetical protein
MSAIWIGLLFQAIEWLVTYLINKHKNGEPLTPREKHNLELCLKKFVALKTAATEVGCNEQGADGDYEGVL